MIQLAITVIFILYTITMCTYTILRHYKYYLKRLKLITKQKIQVKQDV